jgi:general secretion pathway protein G
MRSAFPRNGTGGMTLMEIMVVVAIIGMITALVASVVVNKTEKARVVLARAQVGNLKHALDDFYNDNSFYPSTEQGLDALVHKPATGRIPEKYDPKGYLDSSVVPDDPWGHPYEYTSPTSDGGFEIICRGADGLEGGEGSDADISSRNLTGKQN